MSYSLLLEHYNTKMPGMVIFILIFSAMANAVLRERDRIVQESFLVSSSSENSGGYLTRYSYNTDSCMGAMSAEVIAIDLCFNDLSDGTSVIYNFDKKVEGIIYWTKSVWNDLDCQGDSTYRYAGRFDRL